MAANLQPAAAFPPAVAASAKPTHAPTWSPSPTPKPTATPEPNARYLALGDQITDGYGNSAPCPDFAGSSIYNDFIPCNYAGYVTLERRWNADITARNCEIGYPRYCGGTAGSTMVQAAHVTASGLIARAYPNGCDVASSFYGTYDIRTISTGLETFLPLDGTAPTPATDATDFASALYATIVNIRSEQGCGPHAKIFLFTQPLKSNIPAGCYGRSPGLQTSVTIAGVRYDFSHLTGCALSDQMARALNAIVRETVKHPPVTVCATGCTLYLVDLAEDRFLNDSERFDYWNRGGIFPTSLGHREIAIDFEKVIETAER